jgi:heptosyltransferase I
MRILIIKLGSLGDIVHTLPAAAILRRSFPKARISWAVDGRSGSILENSPAIDQLIELDTKAWNSDLLKRETLSEVAGKLAELRGTSSSPARSLEALTGKNGNGLPGDRPVDIAIDFQGLIKSGVIALASKAPHRIGCETADLREKASRIFLTEQVPTSHARHIIAKNVALARAVAARYGDGLTAEVLSDQGDATDYDFALGVCAEAELYANNLLGNEDSRFALLNPGSAWRTKLWEPSRYAQLSDWLYVEYGLRTLVTHGPGEEALATAVVSATTKGVAIASAATLQEFIALARRAKLFVGPDTGPLHLAAACGTPVVGLYGPTSAERNGPFSSRDLTVSRDLWCRTDCHRRKCWHWECMDISVDDVKRAVSIRLEET